MADTTGTFDTRTGNRTDILSDGRANLGRGIQTSNRALYWGITIAILIIAAISWGVSRNRSTNSGLDDRSGATNATSPLQQAPSQAPSATR